MTAAYILAEICVFGQTDRDTDSRTERQIVILNI